MIVLIDLISCYCLLVIIELIVAASRGGARPIGVLLIVKTSSVIINQLNCFVFVKIGILLAVIVGGNINAVIYYLIRIARGVNQSFSILPGKIFYHYWLHKRGKFNKRK